MGPMALVSCKYLYHISRFVFLLFRRTMALKPTRTSATIGSLLPGRTPGSMTQNITPVAL